MRSIIFLLIISLFYGLPACRFRDIRTPETATPIFIDNSRLAETMDISAMVDTLTIQPLQEADDEPIADVTKIEASARHYYFYDRSTYKVTAFSKDGRYIKTIAQPGEGENEPLTLMDFWKDSRGNIHIYDFAQMKVLTYDSLLGFKGSKKSATFSHFNEVKHLPNSDEYIGFASYNMGNEPYKEQYFNLAFMNRELDIVKTGFHYNKIFDGINTLSATRHFVTYGDSLRFTRSYDNNVYNIHDKKITKRFVIKYAKDPLPEDIMNIYRRDLRMHKDPTIKSPATLAAPFREYTRMNGEWLETDNYVFIRSYQQDVLNKTRFHSVFDKTANKVVYNARAFTAGHYLLQLPPFRYFDQYTHELVTVVDGASLFKLLQPGSPFSTVIENDAASLYLIKLKLKKV